jgi:acyl dehydratase
VPEVRRLASAPALPPLYLRAALPRPARDGVPPEALRLVAVRPDVGHVAAYARLCGFALSGVLPPTYPHLLGFPLQMALMADRRFPFRATGLVHVANTVEHVRPVPLGVPLDVTVTAAGPSPHPRGRSVDLRTAVAADGEEVWTSTSTYLRRAPHRRTGDVPSPDPAAAQGPDDPPTTALWRLPRDLGRRYAAVSGDRNPIHLSAATARLFGFPRAIAHGMWIAAACLASLEGRLPAAFGYAVEFRAAVPLPSTVELATDVRGDGRARLVLRSARSGRAHLRGRVTPLTTSPGAWSSAAAPH